MFFENKKIISVPGNCSNNHSCDTVNNNDEFRVGLSDNIKVRSILGRFLEHSRVFYFHNAPEGQKLYIGSADWMPRNFLRRVEAVFPIEEPEHINSILRDLEYIISDNEGASLLKKDGSYSKVKPSSRTKIKISSQSLLIEDSKSRVNE